MELEVVKFGGTALATRKQMEKAAFLLKQKEKKKILCVVSAMGREGFPYATDTLQNLAGTKISSKEKDRLLACGEILSSVTFSSFLNERGFSCRALSYLESGIKAEGPYGKGKIVDVVKEKILCYFQKYDILLVPGFIAFNEENEIITLGRGNSDLTAVALAAAFSLKKVILYKDVEGVYPYLHSPIKKIKPYEHLSYDEMEILLNSGANIVSYDALLLAKEKKILLYILPFETLKKGTSIDENSQEKRNAFGLFIKDKGFRIACKEPMKIKEELKELFLCTHTLLKEEKIEKHSYFFIPETSQTLLIKRKIIQRYFRGFQKEENVEFH